MAPASEARRRPERSRGDVREARLLEIAEALLREGRFEQASIAELAAAAEISRPTFYFYFASKEAVLLSLLERMLAEALSTRGDTLERLAEDPAARLRESLTAYFDVFRGHRAVTLAGADAAASSAEVREMWAQVMEAWVQETAAAIEAERARGAASEGTPARDLAIALLSMNERVFHNTFARHAPAVEEDGVVDVLVAVWLSAIYGTTDPPRA